MKFKELFESVSKEFIRKKTYVATKSTNKFNKGDKIYITSEMNHPRYRILLNSDIDTGKSDVDDFSVFYDDLVKARFEEYKG